MEIMVFLTKKNIAGHHIHLRMIEEMGFQQKKLKTTSVFHHWDG